MSLRDAGHYGFILLPPDEMGRVDSWTERMAELRRSDGFDTAQSESDQYCSSVYSA